MPLSGSEEFADFLLGHSFPSPGDDLVFMTGCDVSGYSLLQTGFTKPILIPHKEGLRIKVPHSDFTPRDLLDHIDPNASVSVIDVREQTEIQMELKQLVDHFYSCPRTRLLNMLSLEFSKTNLSKLVHPPHVVSELSLISTCWISDIEHDQEDSSEDPGIASPPSVQKYCLLSMAKSYTDFHIDFGGSSVWYHVLWGEKIFYLIPPTSENFSVYWNWCWNPDHRITFLPDLLCCLPNSSGLPCTSHVYEVHISAGQTILLPAGWIHAVYTVSDCLVFGGNFLTELHVPMQLSVYKMERKSGTPLRFQFPNFEKIHWFVADRLVGRLTNSLFNDQEPASYEIEAARCLLRILPRWLNRRRELPVDERVYYLPSRTTLELSHTRLIERLRELVLAFTPFESEPSRFSFMDAGRKHQLHESDMPSDANTKRSKPKHPPMPRSTRSKIDKLARSKFRSKDAMSHCSSPQCSSNTEDFGLAPKLERAHNLTRIPPVEQPNDPASVDQDILDAVPELSTSRLVGDYYFLSLSDSEEDDSREVKWKEHSGSSHRAACCKTHDPDPTWSAACPARKMARFGTLKSPDSFVSPTSRKGGLSQLCLTGGRLHPLLDEFPGSSDGNSLQSSHEKKRVGSPASETVHRRPGSLKQPLTTVRQRLAKRLGL